MKSEQGQKEKVNAEKVTELLRGLVACSEKQFAGGNEAFETLKIDAINLIESCCRLGKDF